MTSARDDGARAHDTRAVEQPVDAPGADRPRRLRDQDAIEQATSALAADLGWSSTRAIAQLARLADATDTNLAEVAAVLTGARLDDLDGPPPDAFDPEQYLRSTPTVAAVLSPPDGPPETADAPVHDPLDDLVDKTVPPTARAVLDAVHVTAGYLKPLRDPDGTITDFMMLAMSDEAHDRYEAFGIQIRGRLLTSIWPGVRESGLFDAYAQVMRTGEPMQRGPFYHSFRQGAAFWQALITCRASRLDDGLIITWHHHREEDRLAERLDHVQRMVDLGWAEWNLATDTTTWSRGMYRIFGRNPDLGPITLREIPGIMLPDDMPVVQEAVRALLDRHQASDMEYRIPRTDGVAHIRVLAEPVLDSQDRVALIRVVAIDLTQQRRDERALESARAELNRQRQLTAVQRRVGRELRQAILPMRCGTVKAHGVRYAVRYLAAESSARIGGDWYTVNDLPDGRVLIGIGDAAGHGLQATALMARMRSGLAGLSYTGAQAGRLTRWLNELVCNDAPNATATSVIGHFDPATRELLWSCAGHPPPILVRDGAARTLDGEIGALLGADGTQRYPQTTTRLRTGDLLLFYTDGLVERRGTDISDGIAALLAAARGCEGWDPSRDLGTVLSQLGLGESEDDACLLTLRVR